MGLTSQRKDSVQPLARTLWIGACLMKNYSSSSLKDLEVLLSAAENVSHLGVAGDEGLKRKKLLGGSGYSPRSRESQKMKD